MRKCLLEELQTLAGIRPTHLETGDGPAPAGDHVVAEALNDGKVRTFLMVLGSALIAYDKRLAAGEAKKGRVNIYRLGHYLDAKQRVEDAMQSAGLLDQDSPEALKALKAAMARAFDEKFSPVDKVVKQIDAFLASGKAPTLKIREGVDGADGQELAESADISEDELVALGIILGLKPFARAKEFEKQNLGPYKVDAPLIKGLIAKGFLSTNKAGVINRNDAKIREELGKHTLTRRLGKRLMGIGGIASDFKDEEPWPNESVAPATLPSLLAQLRRYL